MPTPKLDIARLRLNNGHLIGPPCATAVDVVRWFGAVQAQDFAGAKWAVAQRTRGALERDLDEAFQRGDILRTHVLRPTWHFVLPADLRWLLALSAPRVKQAMATYTRKLGIDARTVARSNHAIASALAGGKHLTREELSHALTKARIRTTERISFLTALAELDAVICSGPRRGKQMTYALVDERCPAAPRLDRDDALGQLARRYFISHGPALVHDFAWWSGLTIADAARGVELARPALTARTVDDRTYWIAEPARPARTKQPLIHLLPNYDEYVVAYKHRAPLAPAMATTLGSRGQLLFSNLVILDGQPIGTWRRTAGKTAASVTTSLATKLPRPAQLALEAAVARFGRYLDVPTQLTT